MSKKEKIKINKAIKQNPKDKNKIRHKDRHKSDKSIKNKIHINDNETELPNSIMQRNEGLSEVQRIKGQTVMQNPLTIISSLNDPNKPQQQIIQYAVPAATNNIQGQVLAPTQYIQNQTAPVSPVPLNFGLCSTQIICPYCNANAATRIEERFNCCSCICCLLNIILIPLLICSALTSSGDCNCNCDCNCGCEKCNGKCCCDINHYCPICGKMIGTRDSLKEICPILKRCC